MAVEKKDVEVAEIADTVGPAANYAIAKNFFDFEPGCIGSMDVTIHIYWDKCPDGSITVSV